jgi:hypothetical protein
MGMCLSGGLETSPYWQQVRLLADRLLRVSPYLSDWTVVVRPRTEADEGAVEPDDYVETGADPAELWHARFNHREKELVVGVPAGADANHEGDPDVTASYIVFDVMDSVLGPDCGDDLDWPPGPRVPPGAERWN